MKKYLYFLQDSPNRPFEINAVSKAEVKALLMDSVPDESHILAIYTEEEFNAKYNRGSNKPQQINEEDDTEYNQNFSNSNDYFNSVLNSVKNQNNQQQSQIIASNLVETIPAQVENNNISQVKVAEDDGLPKYFEDDGISFKLENGKLYRKRWRNINESPDKIEYRILRAKTKKECDKEMFDVEILDWVEFQQK
jgi:hypothetical protein